jgi:hypothetical protein
MFIHFNGWLADAMIAALRNFPFPPTAGRPPAGIAGTRSPLAAFPCRPAKAFLPVVACCLRLQSKES